MTPEDFDWLRRMLKERSGLVLAAEKQYLAESRLLPLARKNGMTTLAELVGRLKAPQAAPLQAEVVDAMTTNETFFFRDKIPFEHFRDTIMPALIAARAREKRIRIWCTAAATGQEPYSLAMILAAMAEQMQGFSVQMLATDLCGAVVARAKAGIYSQFEVQRGLPIQLLVKHFTQTGERWQIAPELRAMVQFRTLNLLNDFSPLGMFDVVFCRNVLIYFDQPTKTGVLNRIARQMPHDGYLLLGAAETVVGLTDAFKPVADKRGLYALGEPVAPARFVPRAPAALPVAAKA
ncbi:MAG: protein-glutamate O-methyltransferase CheR [Pseudolabrys sp.]